MHYLCLLLAGVTVGEPTGWNSEIAKHFLPDAEQDAFMKLNSGRGDASLQNKLLMLFVMPDSCVKCDELRKSINEGRRLHELISDFVAQELPQLPSWLKADAVPDRGSGGWGSALTGAFLDAKKPQVYFVSPDGTALQVHGPDAADPHSFRDEAEVSHAAIAALRLAGKANLADEWDPGVSSHFLVNSNSELVRAQAAKENKPIMVLIMSQWCRACLHLRGAVNKGLQARHYLDDFVVLYSEGPEGREWQVKGHDYIPQAHFFDSRGSRLKVHASEKFHYYFSDDETLAAGMRKALEQIGRAAKMPRQSPWAADIVEQSTESMDPATVKAAAATAEKPLMVIIWQPYCGVCQALIKKVNAGTRFRELLPNFVFTDVHGDAPMKTWQEPGEYYIPQAYFYNKHGDGLDVRGPQEKFKRFFQSEEELADAMTKALSLAKANEL